MAAGTSILRRLGRPRLNTLPAITHGVAATVTGHVHPPGARVRLIVQTSPTAGQPSPDSASWSAPITSDAWGNWTTSVNVAAAGAIKIWVAMFKSPKNMYGQTATAL